MPRTSVIISTGKYLPEKIISNDDLKQFPKALIPLIEEKTGVKARRFVNEGQCTSDIAILAADNCLKKIDFDPSRIDAIILATSSPDRVQPATATRVQHRLGATKACAFDINSVCAGGVYALSVADSFIKAGFYQNILVIAAEVYSKFLNPADFSTYPYFGDGAGALLLSGQDNTDKGIINSILKTEGSKADIIQVPAGGTMIPFTELKNPKDIYFKMVGREVLNFAINKGAEIIKELIAINKKKIQDIKYIIPHQANTNIIKAIALELGIEVNKLFINLDKYGNTAAASVLIALDELVESSLIEEGDLIILVAFGGGLSWGASLIRF